MKEKEKTVITRKRLEEMREKRREDIAVSKKILQNLERLVDDDFEEQVYRDSLKEHIQKLQKEEIDFSLLLNMRKLHLIDIRVL